MDVELPGPQLQVDVYDYDDFTSDDLIGRTLVDLEDRWFDPGWKEMGEELKCSEPGRVLLAK